MLIMPQASDDWILAARRINSGTQILFDLTTRSVCDLLFIMSIWAFVYVLLIIQIWEGVVPVAFIIWGFILGALIPGAQA